jgi:S1-C subfamily serine protease
VPVSAVKRSIAQLEKNGKVEYAYLGVSSQALYPQLAERLGLDTNFGGLVAQVVPGGPADEAGLQGGDHEIHFQAAEYKVGGDVIVAVDGRKVVQPDDLARFTSSFQPGRTVTLTILRDGARREVEVTLGKRPGGSSG